MRTAVKSKTKAKKVLPATRTPPLYQVVLFNDDYTPMEFVVKLLMDVFLLSTNKATHIMLQIHHEGKGICGIYTKDVAETKVAQVIMTARSFGHPLMCQMEKI